MTNVFDGLTSQPAEVRAFRFSRVNEILIKALIYSDGYGFRFHCSPDDRGNVLWWLSDSLF